MKRLPEWLRHPIVWWAWKVNATNRRLSAELDEVLAELAVARCREKRWRRHAHIASEGNPEAEWRVTVQAMSDDIADAPEVDRRNTTPRSAP